MFVRNVCQYTQIEGIVGRMGCQRFQSDGMVGRSVCQYIQLDGMVEKRGCRYIQSDGIFENRGCWRFQSDGMVGRSVCQYIQTMECLKRGVASIFNRMEMSGAAFAEWFHPEKQLGVALARDNLCSLS